MNSPVEEIKSEKRILLLKYLKKITAGMRRFSHTMKIVYLY